MTVTDQIKILDDKIKSNLAQHDLGREAAKISAFSSNDLPEQYEYLTGEDLRQKPIVFRKAKFEYSPLGVNLINNTKSKTNKYKANLLYKTNIWYIIHNIVLQSLRIT